MKKSPNLCDTCTHMAECFTKGIFEREACGHYEALSLDDLAERDEFINVCLVGPCPFCESMNTSDCGDNPLELLIDDTTIGYCKECATYWCLECGYVFRDVRKGMVCPHWRICDECDRMHEMKFFEEICSTCEHSDEECSMKSELDCEKSRLLLCPYWAAVCECEIIQNWLKEQR